MKYRVSFVIFFCIRLVAFSNDIDAVKMLTKRIAPAFADKIMFSTMATGGKDVFELDWQNDHLVIRGSNANSMAVGLNYYLKYFCYTSVSWYSKDKIFLPAKMPVVKQMVHQEARCANRFMLNYCTFGYTMPWWTWTEWERLIDWMALNGINMPLAITGQEYVWYQVWKRFGLTDAQIRSYFVGPAYLPWHRMANIDHWEGPLPLSWVKSQVVLQKKIVSRERDSDMKPVLPAFAGHVPQVLKNRYPRAKVTSMGEWNDFDSAYQSYFLAPF